MHSRRAVTVPVVVVVEVAVLLTLPLSLVFAGVVAVATRSTRPVRTVALVAAYAVIELRTLLRVARGDVDWEALAREVLGAGYGALRRILGVTVALEDGSASTAQLQASSGLVVLARHCGPGDSLFIAWLLMVHHGLALRIVLKHTLRWEPAVDLAGDHLPLCFVAPRRRRSRDDVARVAAGLRRGQALLLFPEGGNFSWQRWREAIRRLTAAGAHHEARRARGRTHTLPPRSGGAVAALAAAPDADVLLLAHSGLGADGRDRPWWRVPVNQQLVVRTLLLPAESVPREDESARAFLDEAWSQVDTWVEGHADLRTLRPER